MRQWPFTVLLAAATVSSCEPATQPITGPGGPEALTPPRLTAQFQGPETNVLTVGDTAQFRVVVWDSSGKLVSPPPVQWSSSDPSVMSIDSGGRAAALSRGSAWIEGAVGTNRAGWGMRVFAPAAMLRLWPDTVVLASGWSIVLTAMALDDQHDSVPARPIAWQAGDTSIITVSPNGLADSTHGIVRGRRLGSSVVTVTHRAVSARASVTVIPLHWTRIWAGGYGTCGLTPEGTLYCWGGAPLAVNSAPIRPAPLPLTFVPESLAIADQFACALDAGGTGHCWGSNFMGQLGRGTVSDSGEGPREIGDGLTFKQLTVGTAHACGVTREGVVYCWGSNSVGQLGAPAASTCALPAVQVPGGGWGGWGGDIPKSARMASQTDVPCSPSPVPVASDLKFTAIAAGESHTCAVAEGGAAYCWGDPFPNRSSSYYGPPPYGPSPVPAAVDYRFASLVSEHIGTCGLTESGEVHCWGFVDAAYNLASRAYRSLAAGWAHSCGIGMDGAAYCWGKADDGQLGAGWVGNSSPLPVAVAGGITFQSLSAGFGHTCGLGTDGKAYCWGSSFYGQLGEDIQSSNVPVRVPGEP